MAAKLKRSQWAVRWVSIASPTLQLQVSIQKRKSYGCTRCFVESRGSHSYKEANGQENSWYNNLKSSILENPQKFAQFKVEDDGLFKSCSSDK